MHAYMCTWCIAVLLRHRGGESSAIHTCSHLPCICAHLPCMCSHLPCMCAGRGAARRRNARGNDHGALERTRLRLPGVLGEFQGVRRRGEQRGKEGAADWLPYTSVCQRGEP